MTPAQKNRAPEVSADQGRDTMPPNDELKFQINCDAGDRLAEPGFTFLPFNVRSWYVSDDHGARFHGWHYDRSARTIELTQIRTLIAQQ